MTSEDSLRAISPRPLARVAGSFYLMTIISGVFAEVFVRARLVVRDNPQETAANILAHDRVYRVGLVADLVMLGCYIAVTIALYILFSVVSKHISALAASFSMVGIAVLGANSLNHVAPLVLLGGGHHPGAMDASLVNALALTALKMHTRGYNVSGVFFGVYCMLVGYLAFKSRFLPRALGVLMAIGGAGYFTSSFAVFLAPALAARLPDVTVLGGLAELSLTLWLIVMGVNEAVWQHRAKVGHSAAP